MCWFKLDKNAQGVDQTLSSGFQNVFILYFADIRDHGKAGGISSYDTHFVSPEEES